MISGLGRGGHYLEDFTNFSAGKLVCLSHTTKKLEDGYQGND